MSFPIPGIANVFARSLAVNVPLAGAIVAGVIGVFSFLKWEQQRAGVDTNAQRRDFRRRLFAEKDISFHILMGYMDCVDPVAKAMENLRSPPQTPSEAMTDAEIAALRRALSGVIL